MTTTVKRGAGRSAAAARTAKAAQRTPVGQAEMEAAKETPREEFNRLTALPLAEQTKAIQARIRKLSNLPENCGPREEAEPETPLSQQTSAQLRETARKLGLSPSAKMPKDKLIGLIYAKTAPAKKAPDVWLDDVVKKDAGKPARSTRKAAGKKATASGLPADGKAARLKEALEPNGWTVTVKTSGERIEATAKRGSETLRQVWVAGAYDYGASSFNGRKVRNLSEAIRLGSRKAES